MRVLYVEDDEISVVVFEEMLRMHVDLDLRVAPDGMTALAVARQWRPDVVVLDAHLPDMTGLELLPALREVPGLHDVPTFMCSGDAMPDDVRQAMSAGLSGYWVKPVDFAAALADLRRVTQAGGEGGNLQRRRL